MSAETIEYLNENTPRTITINLDTGAWEAGGPITGEEGARVAASVLPGMPVEEVARAYSEWLSADPEQNVPGFEGTLDALSRLTIRGDA